MNFCFFPASSNFPVGDCGFMQQWIEGLASNFAWSDSIFSKSKKKSFVPRTKLQHFLQQLFSFAFSSCRVDNCTSALVFSCSIITHAGFFLYISVLSSHHCLLPHFDYFLFVVCEGGKGLFIIIIYKILVHVRRARKQGGTLRFRKFSSGYAVVKGASPPRSHFSFLCHVMVLFCVVLGLIFLLFGKYS